MSRKKATGTPRLIFEETVLMIPVKGKKHEDRERGKRGMKSRVWRSVFSDHLRVKC